MCNNIMYSKINLPLRKKTQNIYIAVGFLPNSAVTMLRYISSALPCLNNVLSCFFSKLKPEEPGWSHLLPGEASPTFIAKFWHDGTKPSHKDIGVAWLPSKSTKLSVFFFALFRICDVSPDYIEDLFYTVFY